MRIGFGFGRLFAAASRGQAVERYVLREHRRGRAVAEILEDPYVRSRTTPLERARLLERPEVVAAIGEHVADELRVGMGSP